MARFAPAGFFRLFWGTPFASAFNVVFATAFGPDASDPPCFDAIDVGLEPPGFDAELDVSSLERANKTVPACDGNVETS